MKNIHNKMSQKLDSKNGTVPALGSLNASDLGCLCPVLDNSGGKGRGDGTFWMSESCPLHGSEVKHGLGNFSPYEKEAIRTFFAEVERLAELNMLKTGKLEGAHYAAMKKLLADNQISK